MRSKNILKALKLLDELEVNQIIDIESKKNIKIISYMRELIKMEAQTNRLRFIKSELTKERKK